MSAASAPVLRAVPPRVSVLPKHLSRKERWTREGTLCLHFERRIRYRRGGGCWREWQGNLRARPDLPWVVMLAVPPVAQWTRHTVSQVIAIARAQLTARGAAGRCRITASVDSRYRVNVIELVIRVGDLRATTRIDAGTIVFTVPGDVVSTVAEVVEAPSPELAAAVKSARQRRTTKGVA